MSISRRQFIERSAVVAAGVTAAATLAPLPDAEAAPLVINAAVPSWAVIALNHLAYGPRPGDVASLLATGLTAYVEQQLNPNTIDDSDCDTRIANARLLIKYAAGTDANGNMLYPATTEARPLTALAKQTSELWPLADFGTPMDWQERIRPMREVKVATWIRAVHSKRQLQEVLVDFWHNHFNVNAASEAAIAATFPVYDRDVIRAHSFGNFRAMLEAVAKSTAMMYYLDNVNNRVSGGEGGNENFARELIELHTLGADNYLKFYDDRRNIGTITYNGVTYARGYIDDDVYETARCLTGWTIKNGHWERPALDDGTFLYDSSWHDTYPKTVLSPTGYPNVPRSQPDMKDGGDVLTLLASHPGTARHICTKLCRRLMSDTPPSTVVDAAVAVWMANLQAPDQLKQVVRAIVLSDQFKTTWGQKIKRPFEALVSYLRATNAVLPNDVDPAQPSYWNSCFWFYDMTGHRLFEWPTPTGYPDRADYWSNTNSVLRRWNVPFVLTQSWGGNVQIDFAGQTNLNTTCTQIVDFWIERLCGYGIDPLVRTELIAFMAQGSSPDAAPKPLAGAPDWNKASGVLERLKAMVHLLAMSPDFSVR